MANSTFLDRPMPGGRHQTMEFFTDHGRLPGHDLPGSNAICNPAVIQMFVSHAEDIIRKDGNLISIAKQSFLTGAFCHLFDLRFMKTHVDSTPRILVYCTRFRILLRQKTPIISFNLRFQSGPRLLQPKRSVSKNRWRNISSFSTSFSTSSSLQGVTV